MRKKPRELLTLAKALQANAYWLETGRGDWKLSSNQNVYDPLTEAERLLIQDFRALLEEDQERFVEEIKARADRMRAYAAKIIGGREEKLSEDTAPRPRTIAPSAAPRAAGTVRRVPRAK